jgi:hypothetical protein
MIKDNVLSCTKVYIDIYIYIVWVKLSTEEDKEIANKSPSHNYCRQECYVMRELKAWK